MQYPPPYGPPGYRPPFPGAPPPGMHPSGWCAAELCRWAAQHTSIIHRVVYNATHNVGKHDAIVVKTQSPCTTCTGMPYAPPPGPMHGMAPPMQRPPSYHGAPITKKTTLYVGKIAHTVTDDTMQSLLSACGELVSWKPMKDADTQAPKGFGFAEFQEADGVLRAVQILQGLDVDGQQLTVKPDTATQRYLDNYLIKHPELVTQGNEEQLSKVMEIISSLAATRAADKAASEFLANVGMGEGVGAAPTAGAGATGGEAPVPAAAPEMSEAARKRSREEREAAERAYRDALRDWERHERYGVAFLGGGGLVGSLLGCCCTRWFGCPVHARCVGCTALGYNVLSTPLVTCHQLFVCKPCHHPPHIHPCSPPITTHPIPHITTPPSPRDRMKLLEADRERERRAEAERARVIRMDLQGGGGDDAPRWKRPLYKDRCVVGGRTVGVCTVWM